jgi:hypothetical protein
MGHLHAIPIGKASAGEALDRRISRLIDTAFAKIQDAGILLEQGDYDNAVFELRGASTITRVLADELAARQIVAERVAEARQRLSKCKPAH